MSSLIIVLLIISGVGLIGYALHKKSYVRASISLKPFGFFLEAGEKERSEAERDTPKLTT
jgi:hypothetical protein